MIKMVVMMMIEEDVHDDNIDHVDDDGDGEDIHDH